MPRRTRTLMNIQRIRNENAETERKRKEAEAEIEAEKKRKQIEEESKKQQEKFVNIESVMIDKNGEIKPMMMKRSDLEKISMPVVQKNFKTLIAGFMEADNHEQYIKNHAESIKALSRAEHQKFFNGVVNIL